MNPITLTKEQARRFILSYQGLYPPHADSGKDGILGFIHRVGCVQYDPLNIVGRNPDLVLQSRIADYRPTMLRELLYEDRKLLDGWDKMMAIYPLEDWPYFRRYREAAFHDPRAKAVESIMPAIRRALEERGPLSSLDLEFDLRVDWPWGPARSARAAMENMFFRGELVVHHRINTRRIYDLAERQLSTALLEKSEPNPTQEEYLDWHIHRRISSFGLIWNRSGEAWLGIIGAKAGERRVALERLKKKNRLIEVGIDGLTSPCYIPVESHGLLNEIVCNQEKKAEKAAFLAPLDNLLWDRRFIQELFNFDYRWEVYKPVSKRRYGYYVLPILFGHRFVGRFEPRIDKNSQALIVEGWWWESDVVVTDTMRSSLVEAFRRFMVYTETKRLHIKPAVRKRNELEFLRRLTPI